jgi:hypothetical protein
MSDQQPPQGYGPPPAGYPPQGYGPPPGYPGYPPPAPPKPAWYHSSIVMGLSLFFCAPIGLILLWTSKATSMTTKVLGTVVFGGLLLFAMAGTAGKKTAPTYTATTMPVAAAVRPQPGEREQRRAAPAEVAAPVSESCLALATKFGSSSKLSDLQKDELWKAYEGKVFEWDLKITEVSAGILSGFTVQAKCAPRSPSLIQDVQLSYGADAKAFVMGLEKDSTYKLKGVLTGQNSLLGLRADGAP